MDGALIAVTEISDVLNERAAEYRLIGGMAVLLHMNRASLDLPQRATRDADFGVTKVALSQPGLIRQIESLGYQRDAGNRWGRQVRGIAATIDILVPTYTSRARSTVLVGQISTTEVPGLAEALTRPAVVVNAKFELADGTEHRAKVLLPDALGLLALKCGARSARDEQRDAIDLWSCLEVAYAGGVGPDSFDGAPWDQVKMRLIEELVAPGRSLSHIVSGLSENETARRTTRIRGLMLEVVGSAN